jgi:alkanesulfonate monooxygenase SsuD/methylene tetrahydromethanopterin reductase-like flavin-dependent oxidoreductase (luciferase family)
LEAFHFTEMPYPYIPDDYVERYGGARVTLPNGLYDRQRGHELYNAYLDQHEYADELGYDIFLNEHHQTVTCVNSAVSVTAGALTRRTKRARILILGNAIGNREQPLRVAEEIALLDSISGGRIECGFLRGVPGEIHPSNVNPVFNRERFGEAHDLIIKAWTTPEPFAWEGKHYQFRYVNVWPRPFQQPHPPIWVSGVGTLETVDWAAAMDYTYAIFLAPWDMTARLFDRYREQARAAGHAEPGPERFAYALLLFVGDSEEQAQRDGRGLEWYLSTRQARGFWFPPGHSPVEATAKGWAASNKGAGPGGAVKLSWEQYQEAGIAVIGTPDTVIKKLRRLYDQTGTGQLLMMMHAGKMPNDVVMRSQKLFATEVLPAMREFDRTPRQP